MPAPSTDPTAGDERRRRRRGLWAIVALAVGWGLVMQSLGWAQTSYYALVKSLADGTPQIDRYHWETRDKAWTDGHFYSVKAPMLSFVTLPAYLALDAAGAKGLARDAVANAQRHGGKRWAYRGLLVHQYGYSADNARRVRARQRNSAPMIWALTLIGVVVPAALLLLLVRRVADGIEPGFGAAAAVTLGAGTLIMPFAAQLFGHVLAALLGFSAFAVLWRERAGPQRLALVLLAGLVAGLAVSTEYPLAIAGGLCGVYALARGDVLRRGATYAAGVVAGLIPLLGYNLWAFGTVAHFSYADAVNDQGRTGHATLGLNDGGFFGITRPSLHVAGELLFASRGLLVLCPVLVMALAGLVLIWRRGLRWESGTIGAVALGYLVYNSGYWLPFGGGSPGPRFLIPLLPFLAVGLAPAYRRFPATTLALAVPSVLTMLIALLTQPLIGDDDVGRWVDLARAGSFEHTVVTVLGGDNGWAAIAPVLLGVVLALGLAAAATPAVDLRPDLPRAALAVAAWAGVAAVAPGLFGFHSAARGDGGELALILTGAGMSLATLLAAAALTWRRRRRAVAREPALSPGAA